MTFFSDEHVLVIRRQQEQLRNLHRQHQEERTGNVSDKTTTEVNEVPVETAGKDSKHTNPVYTSMPESMLEELPQHVGKLVPQTNGWVHVKSFLVHKETGEVFLSKKTPVLKTMPRTQYAYWCYIRRTDVGGYIVSMLPRDFLYTITYETPSEETHIRITHLIFRVKATKPPVA